MSNKRTMFKLAVAQLFLLSLFLPGSSYSQFKIGITSGINYSSLSGDSPKNADYGKGIGAVAGLTTEFNITKSLKINIQPRYVQRNGKISYDVNQDEPVDSFKTKLSYISLPVILKVPALTNNTFFNGGVDFSYLIKSEMEYELVNSPPVNLEEALKKFDLAMLFGFGVNIPVGKKFGIEIEARYSQSILNLSSGSKNLFNGGLPDRFRSGGFQLLSNINYTL